MSIKSYQSTVYESSHEVYFQVFSNILRIPNQVLLDWWNTLKQSHKLYNLRHNTSQLTSSFSSLNIFIYYKKTFCLYKRLHMLVFSSVCSSEESLLGHLVFYSPMKVYTLGDLQWPFTKPRTLVKNQLFQVCDPKVSYN